MYKEHRGREGFLGEPCLHWGVYAVWRLGSSPAVVLLAYLLGLSAAQLLKVSSKHPITLCMWGRWGRMSTWIHRTAREITITTPAVVVGDIFLRPSHRTAGLLQSTWCCCALRTVRSRRGRRSAAAPLPDVGRWSRDHQGSLDRGQIFLQEDKERGADFLVTSKRDIKVNKYQKALFM